MKHFDAPLPIDEALPALRDALAGSNCAVLVAPPGAGKTTRVPLALLDEPWLGRGKILVLEPRRIAARGTAEFMARSLGQSLGDTVGLRARLISRVSAQTRIEVVTEGVFTRMILEDPSLEGVGAVLFDEFHERSLDADLGLALALDAQSALRADLRILPMSATLDGARVADLLGGARVIESQGRAYPVTTRYLGRVPGERIEQQVVDAVLKALAAERGSILAFLPGQGEIRRACDRLSERVAGRDVDIAPLYGAMEGAAQDRAIQPASPGRRKVVLATSIAETSLTIEGVRVVIDCGLARVPRHEPDVGVTRLDTVRVSRAAADQRRGRAGRIEPGVCYRLWDEPETASLAAFATPEIQSADLSGLLLDCAAWGESDPRRLRWLDPPTDAAIASARDLLQGIGALDADGRITAQGRRIRALPLPPHLANMVLVAADHGDAESAAFVAALIVERGLGGQDTDLERRLERFKSDRGERARQMRNLALGWARQATAQRRAGGGGSSDDRSIAAILAWAYPDRIAKARGAPGQYLLANGRGGVLDPADPLARAPMLVVADMSGTAAATRILLAAPLDPAEAEIIAADRVTDTQETAFDAASGSLRTRQVRRLGAIVIEAKPLPVPAEMASAEILAAGIARIGLSRLPWSKAQERLRNRVAFIRQAGDLSLPDLSDEALSQSVAQWLAPAVVGRTRLSEITAEDLDTALDTLLPWDARRRLDNEAPTHYEAPTGNRHPIHYDGAQAPLLSIRVQELFGLKAHPAIVGGRLPLTLELLSPAHRPIQVTRDLPGFWRGSWHDVVRDMRGRYPRHPWPDDPASAAPTTRAKPRGR